MRFGKISLLLGLLYALPAMALSPGDAAPDFTAQASNGKTVHLSDYKGKTVVLEWTNFGCPFVKKHYNSGNMQSLQKKYTGEGVVWLSVNSGAPGKEGYANAAQTEKDRAAHKVNSTTTLLDAKGTIGHLYGAQSTPHMFVINADGKLVYEGAIDDKPSTDIEDIKSAKNYVSAALDETLAGKPVTIAQTKSYGCGVKY